MRGTLSRCLSDLVIEVYGATTWDEIVSAANTEGRRPGALHIALSDVEDVETLALIDAACRVLGVSLAEIADLLGEYWCCVYAPDRHQISWNEFGSARECLEALDAVHGPMRPSNSDAAPARSLCDWRDDKTVRVEYRSDRGLIDLYVGLVRGIGTALGESLRVTKVTSSAVEVVFA